MISTEGEFGQTSTEERQCECIRRMCLTSQGLPKVEEWHGRDYFS